MDLDHCWDFTQLAGFKSYMLRTAPRKAIHSMSSFSSWHIDYF